MVNKFRRCWHHWPFRSGVSITHFSFIHWIKTTYHQLKYLSPNGSERKRKRKEPHKHSVSGLTKRKQLFVQISHKCPQCSWNSCNVDLNEWMDEALDMTDRWLVDGWSNIYEDGQIYEISGWLKQQIWRWTHKWNQGWMQRWMWRWTDKWNQWMDAAVDMKMGRWINGQTNGNNIWLTGWLTCRLIVDCFLTSLDIWPTLLLVAGLLLLRFTC